ncbi:MAG: MBL fold metallo-hydrolase [Candidatus Freyarchaeota archaeon]
MRVRVLGTSSGWPYPRIGCRCPICSSRDPRDKRLRPSILVEGVLVDAGPDIYHQFMRFNVEEVEAIVLTHAHPDHVLGLNDLTPRKVASMGKATLYASEETWNVVCSSRILSNLGFKWMLFPSSSFEVGSLTFTPIRVVHAEGVETFAFKIEDGSSSLLYAPDFLEIPPGGREVCMGVDVAFLDGSTLRTPPSPLRERFGHLGIYDAVRVARELGVGRVFFTHIGHSTAPHAVLEEMLRKEGSLFHVAYDGLELKI